MTATTDTKVWAYSRKGTRLHAMLRTADNGTVLVAACRGDISRGASAVELRERTEVPAGMLCASCVKRHDAHLAALAEVAAAPSEAEVAQVAGTKTGPATLVRDEGLVRQALGMMTNPVLAAVWNNPSLHTTDPAAAKVAGWVMEELEARMGERYDARLYADELNPDPMPYLAALAIPAFA